MENDENFLKFHTSKYLQDDIGLGFAIDYIGREKCIPSKPPTIHEDENQYTFHFILHGSGYLINKDKLVQLKTNDVFFFPPNRDNCNAGRFYFPDKNDPWEYIWFNLVGEDTQKLLACTKMTVDDNYYSIQNPTSLRQQMKEMSAVCDSTDKRNVSFFLPYVAKFFAEIAEERKMGRNITEKERKVKEIVDIIEQSYTSPDFSIHQIAQNLYYTTSYISRIFREVTNVSPMEYVTSLRMLRSRDLLRTKDYSISQIAYMVGYHSPFYFSKEFKKYFGYSPSQIKFD